MTSSEAETLARAVEEQLNHKKVAAVVRQRYRHYVTLVELTDVAGKNGSRLR